MVPHCGVPSNKSDCFIDEKQLLLKQDRMKESFRVQYQCPCDPIADFNTIGKCSKKSLDYKLVQANIKQLAKVLKLEETDLTQCPWLSFQDPLCQKVLTLLFKLEQFPSMSVDNEEHIVVDALLFFKGQFNKVNNWIIEEENKAREEERKKNAKKH